MGYFPRTTEPYQRRFVEREWHYAEPSTLRKVAFSLLDMALITALTLRLGRALVLSYGGAELLVTALVAGALFLCLMAALHLGNFPIRHWVWRAPMFGAAVGAAESGVSLLLISLGREPYGSGQATFADWLAMPYSIIPWRVAIVVVFAVGLAMVVQGLRMTALRREGRL
jgi:hypothetical protein